MRILHRISQGALLALLILISRHLIAQGNLVFNGGFDAGAMNWVLTNGAAWAGPDKGNPGGFVDLDLLNPDSTTDPTAYQIVNGLISGQTYLVSGDYEKTIARTDISGPSFGVALDDVFLFETDDPGDFTWHSFSFLYTATSTSAVLSLSSQINGTGVSYGIDNIAMYATPEPGELGLWVLGALALLFPRRRRKSHLPRKESG